jgi:hypothetical protein
MHLQAFPNGKGLFILSVAQLPLNDYTDKLTACLAVLQECSKFSKTAGL